MRSPRCVLSLALLAHSCLSHSGASPACWPSGPCAAAGTVTIKGWVQTKDPATSCAPDSPACSRPCGVFHHYLKMAGGFLVSSAFLQPAFAKPNITWCESMTLGDAKTNALLAAAREQGHATMTALRHPVDRIVAHFFATSDEGSALNQPCTELREWVMANSARAPRRGNDGGTRLWIELDNLYTKVEEWGRRVRWRANLALVHIIASLGLSLSAHLCACARRSSADGTGGPAAPSAAPRSRPLKSPLRRATTTRS